MNSSYSPSEPIIFQTRQHAVARYLLASVVIFFTVLWITITVSASVAFTTLSKTLPEGIGRYSSNGTEYRRIGNEYRIGTERVSREDFIARLQKEESTLKLFLAPFWIIGIGLTIGAITTIRKTSLQEVILTRTALYVTKADLPEVIREYPTATITTTFTNKTFLDKFLHTASVTITTAAAASSTESYEFHSRFTIPLVLEGNVLEEKVREVTA